MSYFSKRALRWAAPVALVGALGLAACGDDDTEAVRVAAPGAAGIGSDRHLNNQAEEIARASASAGSNRAAELAQQERAYRAASARIAVRAEQYERSAHLEGQANTYSGTDVPTNSDANLSNPVEAGNRAAQAAQADGYVEQLQDRAGSNASGNDSYDDEFLPGSRHVPMR
jgi:hypothetical protein